MSDDRVITQLRSYGAWIEREAGVPLQSPSEPSLGEHPMRDRPGDDRARWWWFGRRPTLAFGALAAVTVLVVVVAVATLRPAGDPSALFTRSDDPQGPLFVLPGDDSGNVVSGGIINSESAPASAVTGRVWIGTPDGSGTTFRDVVQVCVARVPAECSSMPTPDNTRDRIEIDDRFLQVTTSNDGSITVVSDQRDLLHIAVRSGPGHEPVELATLLTEIAVDDNGVPSVEVEAPQVVFATRGNVADLQADRLYSTSFQVDASNDDSAIAVSTATGTPLASTAEILPGLLELDEVSFADEIIDGVTVTKFSFVVPESGTFRGLAWQASPNRLISVGGPQASFAELTALARSLREASETDWKDALPDHQVFENSQPVEDD